MTIDQLRDIFCSDVRLKAVRKLLGRKGVKRACVGGLAGSSPAMLLAGLRRQGKPLLVVADDFEAAGYLYNDLCRICGDKQGEVQILPSGYKRAIHYGQPDAPSRILRTEALEAISSGRALWVVTSPEGLAEKVPAPSSLADATITLRRGETYSMTDLRQSLLDMGFFKVEYVYEPGQFAIRGSIVDIYSYSSDYPYRIDFFDDEIDSIRTFDVETQLSHDKQDYASVVGDKACAAGDEISLLQFMGDDVAVVCRSEHHLVEAVRTIASTPLSPSVEQSGEGDPDAMTHVVDADEFEAALQRLKILEISAAEVAPTAGTETVNFHCSHQTLYHKNFQLISESFTKFLADGYTIYLLTDSASQIDRLRAIFADRGDNISFTPVETTIHEGFIDHDLRICCLTDHQIFDRFHKFSLRSDRARSGKLALSLKELNQIETGDYIVHIDHGVGRFGGLVKTDVAGRTQEMIKLIYQGDDIIFVSIHALHKLSKYRGKEGVPPKINKLGTGAWNRLKERTKTKMKDIARDLIRLYAARREEKGFAFSPDSYLQHELEASFAYEDTPDQLTATQAVKKDMEAPLPMDRLICGDVGFGKTEIAIRAAFKAAADSKQTAVLVPTTVLAMQHYHTFVRRLADLPVKVDFISRARKPKDVKRILEELREGKIDILIGTHKLIGKNVQFKDLGLLVVDEEQKFGVAVKERLKQLKVNVDTLTMSATPIPRTLQFSLMGARDLSNLNTPPANRRPILTTVDSENDDIIREAVNFETSRGGQVFYICNRISRLRDTEERIRRLVPDARIVTAHGQMPPEELEKAILDFANHDYDVLLSTTIIESGIDMPNVNTMIVADAQNFGLSELHQLRGRVGRSDRKAFCYLLTPPGVPLTSVARRRLQAIENFSDLGSGIHIAMQDLDIRGAGNLLGAEQSGFIADLGYETYQKILKESVVELKNEEFADTFTASDADGRSDEFVADCTIETDIELRLPPEYVPGESERISLYRRLDSMENTQEIEAFRADLRDRFGVIPQVTEELIRIVPLRSAAKRLGIEKLYLKQGRMYLYFVGEENVAYYNSPAFGRVLAYVQQNPRSCTLRERASQRSIVVADVPTVSDALDIITDISTLSPV